MTRTAGFLVAPLIFLASMGAAKDCQGPPPSQNGQRSDQQTHRTYYDVSIDAKNIREDGSNCTIVDRQASEGLYDAVCETRTRQHPNHFPAVHLNPGDKVIAHTKG